MRAFDRSFIGRRQRYAQATGLPQSIVGGYLRLNNGQAGGIVGQSAQQALRMARAHALAEQHACFRWEADPEGCSGCDCKSRECACSAKSEHETEGCVLVIPCPEHGNGCKHDRVLGSLWSICGATDAYRFVVECELALEAVDELQEADEAVNPSCIHTTCKHCDADIEGMKPFPAGEWLDRGGNSSCNADGAQQHEPIDD